MVVRSIGARLAVLLTTLTVTATTVLAVSTLEPRQAEAADGCAYSIDGINCWYGGTTTSTLPPYRYLRTREDPGIGTCWYWSRYPPGLDSFNWLNDALIIQTRFDYPDCSSAGTITTRAWEVFRAFPLRVPSPRIRPSVGITNLASIVTTTRPAALRHSETLPDGRLLEVEAYVGSLRVAWGDGTPAVSYPPSTAFRSGASYAYALKTCPPVYRRDHPAGRRCHPTLESYPVTVSFAWLGRFRTNSGTWVNLGTLLRSASFGYDVDEVIGMPVAP